MTTRELEIRQLEMPHEHLSVKDSRGDTNLLSSLSEIGQQSPVIVVKVENRYVLIDGHKRVRALKKLKMEVAQAMVWELSEAEALAWAYRMSAYGNRNAFEEGWLIETLHRSFRLTLGEIGKKLLRSKSWVSRRLSLVEELPAPLSEAIAKGRVGVNAAVTYLGPLWRHNNPEARGLAEKMQVLDLTDREMREVVGCYQTAKPEVKRKIAEDPGLFMRARRAAHMNLELNDVESRCVKNLTIIGNICLGLVKNLPEALPSEAGGQARQAIQQAWGVCGERWQLLEKTAAGVLHAG